MKRWFATILWRLSEFTGLGLGRFAPDVFAAMVERPGNRKF